MNKIQLLIVSLLSVFILSCTESSNQNQIDPKADTKVVETKSNDIPFKGKWSRTFSMGEGMEQEVSYTIEDKKIVYAMTGAMPMEYSILMDAFVPKDNRWIGKKGEDTYVIFVKNISKESISLFKQKVDNKDAALTMEFPSDTTRSKFTSWNVYNKVN